jgi:outer membrane protein assembly factor BamD (BamD/ComL family)
VIQLVRDAFVAVKIPVKQQPRTFERFKALWTPTQLILDANGIEHYRIEGFLPPDDFLAELETGLAKLELENKHYDVAARGFHSVCDRHPNAGAAPKACYWAAVADHKTNHQAEGLKAAAKTLRERYPDSEWARKASVWAA